MVEVTGVRVGWIGTGRMGFALAARLAKGGVDLSVWNRTRVKAQPLVTHGAKVLDFLADLADRGVEFMAAQMSGLELVSENLVVDDGLSVAN